MASSQVATQSSDSFNSQAATQPANGIDSQSQQIPEANSWAKLVHPSRKTPGCAWLTGEYFKVGKLVDCDISVFDIPIGEIDPDIVSGVSKIHFIIQRRYIREIPVAFIKDTSSNGTYINGELVGKGQIRILGHNDQISVVKAECKFWKFYYWPAENRLKGQLSKQVNIDFMVVDLINAGSFNQVYYALHKKTCDPCVMKFANISLNIHKDDGISTELKILRSTKHANIIGFRGNIMIDTRLYLFLDYMDGGDLGMLLRRKGRLSESLTRIISKQILSGLEYLHNLKFAHRKIRPKNILLDSNETCPTVKIQNFRSCKKLRKGDSAVETLGNTIYDAPETKIPWGRYDVRVDVWSFGVLLYVCLCGREPMDGRENNTEGKILYSPRDVWSQISCSARKVVEMSLNYNQKTRFHSAQISNHSWFTGDLIPAKKRPNILSANSTPKRFKTNC